MPRIINAYEGNSAIGDSLAKLGEAIYGDGAKNEVYRQKALETKRGNDNAEPFAAAVRDGRKNDIGYYGALSNHTGADLGQFNLVSRTNHATGLDDPAVALSQLGAGGSAASTFAGQGRALANDRATNAATNAAGERNNVRTNAETHYSTDQRRAGDVETTGMNNQTSRDVGAGNNDASRDVARINADKTAQSEKYKFDNTYENTYDPETNRTVLTPRSQAAGRQAPPTKEGVVGRMLQTYADQQTTGGPAASQSPSNPFAGIPPQIQHVMGVGMPPQSMVNPSNNATGVSHDGGQTVTMPDGSTSAATGFQPVDQGTALNEARGNVQRAATSKPLTVQNPATSQAAQDASRSSGLGPKVSTILNDELGAIPGVPSVIKALSGSPQIAPGVQDARQTQDIRNNQARAVLLGAPGRQTTQAQKWVNELLPQGDAFANPATEAAKIPKIVGALQGDHEQLRQIVQTTADPVERAKAMTQMHAIENTIRMYTDPAPPTAGAQPAAAAPAAPAAGAPAAPTQTATGPGGQKIGLVNGQWVPM